jgi:class 3 adenylate cyclase
MSQIESEGANRDRREAAVMFADISGFTALAERLDPEEVTTLINRCFERLEAVVFAHGGIIDEYLGDCLKAIFGLVPSSGEPAAHAVRAALEIRAAIASLRSDSSVDSPLDVHIGINSGPVITLNTTGPDGTRRFSVMGEGVRLAARLEDASRAGEILVGPQTQAQTHDEFEYRPANHAGLADGAFLLIGQHHRQRLKRQSERRHATIMFADLLGMDALAQQLDASALGEMMTRSFAEMSGAVTDHGGFVDKYMGDGLMALFGIPNAIENAPKQAVNAAIDMRRRFARMAEKNSLPIAVHIGINTGLVIAGEIGGRVRRDFSAMGDTVNLAARLKDEAPAGAIYVGPETHRYTGRDFDYAPLPAMTLRGKSAQVPVFELRSETKKLHHERPRPTGRMVFSDIVGRDAELELLYGQFNKVRQRMGGAVSVVAEAGMGKTRLLAEAARMIDRFGISRLQGRSLSIGGSLAFHPFIDLLRQLAGIDAEESESKALAKLESTVAGLVGQRADELLPLVATLMGLRPSPQHAERLAGIQGDALEKMIVRSMRELLAAVGERGPTVIVLEDLQWADRSSRNLLEALLPLALGHPLLFILSYRPEFEEAGAAIVDLCRQRLAERHVELRLPGLDRRQSGALIRNLLMTDEVPERVAGMIVENADGNPFYIEEVVRGLIDEGVVEYGESGFVVTDKVEKIVIPGTIQDVVMARVDRLDESARRLLQVASVIGRTFYHRIIATILEDHTNLEDDLRGLKEKQLLIERWREWEVPVGETSIAEELEYLFKHALAQETIYESILHRTRKQLHARVASTIETLYGDRLSEFYGTLSHHYLRAEDWEKAEDCLFKAGAEATRSAAHREALHFFRESRRLYDKLHGDGGDRQRRARLEKNIGLALLNTGELSDSIEHFDAALACLGRRVPRSPLQQYATAAAAFARLLAQLYLGLRPQRQVEDWDAEREAWEVLFNRGRAEITSDPTRLFLDTVTGFPRLNEIDASRIDQASAIYASCASVFSYSGISFGIARKGLENAKQLIRPGSIKDRFTCAAMEFTLNYLQGIWDDRSAVEDALVQEALRHGQLWDVNTYVGLRCDQLLRQGRFEAASAQLALLAEINDSYGYAFAGANHDGMKALLLIEQRRLDEALAIAEQYERSRRELPLKVLGFGMVAKIHALRGDVEAAQASLRGAEEITQHTREIPPWHLSAYAVARLRVDMTCLTRSGSDRAARRRAEEGTKLARGIARKAALQQPEIFRLLGRGAWLHRKPREAIALWSRSIDAAKKLGARPELARCYAEVARSLDASTPSRSAAKGLCLEATAENAEILFKELGLERDLAALSAVDLRAA